MATFLSLPLEALELIFEHVAIVYRPSLCALRLVNKQCCFIATRKQLGRISINIARLEEDANYWTNRLQKFSALGAVRHLSIVSSTGNEQGVDAVDQDELTRPVAPHILIPRQIDIPSESWTPLAWLLQELPGLQHVLWSCETQFPASLLEVLYHALPHCRLHIRGFNLPSLHYNADHPQDIDKHDLALATSPSLASVVVPVSQYDDSGCVEYNEEAVMQIATGLAPNLVEVHIVDQPPGASPDYFRAVDRGRPPWPGFFPNTPSRQKKFDTESLVSLHVFSLSPCSMSRLAPWENRLDFSTLRTLQLWDVDAEALEALSRRGHNFSSLRTLAIQLEYPQDPISETYSTDLASLLDSAAASFLSSLPPLQNIRLSRLPGAAISERAFQAVMSRHGTSLHTLSLTTPPTGDPPPTQATTLHQIDQMKSHCPNLRDLRLPIHRTHGNAAEVAIYNALGSLTTLTDLLIQFHITEPSSPETENQLSKETLLSAPVDETLVREIFTLVFDAGARRLQRLKVRYCEGSTPVGFRGVASGLVREWDCMNLSGFGLPSGVDGVGLELEVQEAGVRRGEEYLQTSTRMELSVVR
ncbi:hypothetical protein BDV12DRAFT_202666 [Aspergillus spectabilis]